MEKKALPLIKVQRKEKIMYTPEWLDTLDKASELGVPQLLPKPTRKQGTWLAAWLGFDWAFGKRRNEISKLIRKDVWTEQGYLYVRFYVGKKRARTATIDQTPYTKRKTLKHKAMPYILEYLEDYDKAGLPPESYLFPWKRARATSVIIHTKFKNKEGNEEIREYVYDREIGYINPAMVLYYTQKVNPNMWLHLGRHSVATKAAEDGATEYDICNIIDVSPRTASKYVHHGTALTEEWSKKAD